MCLKNRGKKGVRWIRNKFLKSRFKVHIYNKTLMSLYGINCAKFCSILDNSAFLSFITAIKLHYFTVLFRNYA